MEKYIKQSELVGWINAKEQIIQGLETTDAAGKEQKLIYFGMLSAIRFLKGDLKNEDFSETCK